MIAKISDIVKNKKGVKILQGRVWAGGTSPCTLNSGGSPAKRVGNEGGQKFLPPNPFPFCPPERLDFRIQRPDFRQKKFGF